MESKEIPYLKRTCSGEIILWFIKQKTTLFGEINLIKTRKNKFFKFEIITVVIWSISFYAILIITNRTDSIALSYSWLFLCTVLEFRKLEFSIQFTFMIQFYSSQWLQRFAVEYLLLSKNCTATKCWVCVLLLSADNLLVLMIRNIDWETYNDFLCFTFVLTETIRIYFHAHKGVPPNKSLRFNSVKIKRIFNILWQWTALI